MRPTLAEQLRGLRHVLDTVVEPTLDDEYVRSVLQGVSRSLAMLEARSSDVDAFLRWDNHETEALLHRIDAVLPNPGLDIDPPVREAAGVVDLDAHNERLRALLADAVPVLAVEPDAAEVYGAVIAHLRARIDRYPYISTATLPSR